MLTFNAGSVWVTLVTRTARANRPVVTDPTLGIITTGLLCARILALLLKACKVQWAIGVTRAFGAGDWEEKMKRLACSTHCFVL